jgi:hypothetical protein
MKQDQVRVLRVIEYVGDRDIVEKTVAASIQGEKNVSRPDGTSRAEQFGVGNMLIRAATIGIYPELLEAAQPEQTTTKDDPLGR